VASMTSSDGHHRKLAQLHALVTRWRGVARSGLDVEAAVVLLGEVETLLSR